MEGPSMYQTHTDWFIWVRKSLKHELFKDDLTSSVDLHDTQEFAIFSMYVFQSGNGDIHKSHFHMLHNFLQYILTFCSHLSKLTSFN